MTKKWTKETQKMNCMPGRLEAGAAPEASVELADGRPFPLLALLPHLHSYQIFLHLQWGYIPRHPS